jgi:hypothetical protein
MRASSKPTRSAAEVTDSIITEVLRGDETSDFGI